jgi:precorrin-2 dehydrogenase/sirohydrochlorin ferrochelatase
MYPIFIKIKNKPCLVVGGGKVALRKINDLVSESAQVTVIAPTILPEILESANRAAITVLHREYRPGDSKGFFLVFAATDNHHLNRSISEEIGNSALFNSVDEPELCNFYSGAVIKRGKLRVAVSTSGAFPALTKKIKKDLDDCIPESYERLIEVLSQFRDRILQKEDLPEARRKEILNDVIQPSIVDAFLKGDETPLIRVVEQCG